MSTIHLIRHAKAKNRLAWENEDHLRPLSKRGRREAATIAARLADEPIARLVSSPYLRCLQTLGPLSAALALEIETTATLAEGADGDAAHAFLLSLAGTEPVVCCTHGDVLLEVVERVARAGVPLSGPLLVPVASAWVLEVEDAHVVSGRFVEQPPR